MRGSGVVEIIDSFPQQAPNGHGGPREIVRPQELLKPAKNALNNGVISGGSYPGHTLRYMVLLKEIGVAGRRELRSLVAVQDHPRWAGGVFCAVWPVWRAGAWNVAR